MASNVSLGACTISDDPAKCEAIVIIRKVIASFSFLGCFFMILVIWLFRKYVVFAQRLILFLSIGALMDSIAFLMSSTIEDGPLCDFQAWWLTYFDWTVLLWVTCLTFNLYMNVVMMKTTEQWEKIYHAVCWGLPLLLSCLPFINDHYGPAGAWCWIAEDVGWRLGIWYIPLFIIIGFLFFVYLYIFFMLRKRATTWEGTYDPDTERNHRMLKEDIKPLQFYPCVYLIVSVFPLINRINNAVHPGHEEFWMVVMASISAPLHGVFNAIIFGMDKETMKKLTPTNIKLAVAAKVAGGSPVREYTVARRLDSEHMGASVPAPEDTSVDRERLYPVPAPGDTRVDRERLDLEETSASVPAHEDTSVDQEKLDPEDTSSPIADPETTRVHVE